MRGFKKGVYRGVLAFILLCTAVACQPATETTETAVNNGIDVPTLAAVAELPTYSPPTNTPQPPPPTWTPFPAQEQIASSAIQPETNQTNTPRPPTSTPHPIPSNTPIPPTPTQTATPTESPTPSENMNTEPIDLIDYIMPSGTRQYIIQNDNGISERYQPQPFKRGHLIQKQGQGEYYEADEDYIYLIWDTTPNGDEFYHRATGRGGVRRSPYLPRIMTVGQVWEHDDPHYVTFYKKRDCRNASSSYEGAVIQKGQLLAHHEIFITPYGRLVRDVVVISTGAEKQYYAKGVGRIGWESAWGNAWMTSEDVSQQPPVELELPRCLG